MIDYTDDIERFLRGHMNIQEEKNFLEELKTTQTMRLQALIMSSIIKSKAF